MHLIRTTVAFVALVCLALPAVDAHTKMYDPKPVFPTGFYKLNNYYGIIDSKNFTAKLGKFNNAEGVKNIATAMKAENTPSLRQFVVDHISLLTLDDSNKTSNGTGKAFHPGLECGFTSTTGPRLPVPEVVNFPWTHPGPCEIWCDNVRLLSNSDCQGNKIPNKFTMDKTKCAGASLLQAMFVGVHTPRWQVFTNCVPLQGGTGTDPKKVFNYRDASDDNAAKDDDATVKPTTTAPSTRPSVTPPPKCKVLRD